MTTPQEMKQPKSNEYESKKNKSSNYGYTQLQLHS